MAPGRLSENVITTWWRFFLKVHHRDAEGAELSFLLGRAAETSARHNRRPPGSFPPPPHALHGYRFRRASFVFSRKTAWLLAPRKGEERSRRAGSSQKPLSRRGKGGRALQVAQAPLGSARRAPRWSRAMRAEEHLSMQESMGQPCGERRIKGYDDQAKNL